MAYSNGARYEGCWRLNKFNGQGTLLYCNQDYYKGSFLDGIRNGKG